MEIRCIAIVCVSLCTILLPIAQADMNLCDERLHYLEWTQKYFDSADAVFLGKIVAEETPNPPTQRAQPASERADGDSKAELLELIEAGKSRDVLPDLLQNATLEVDKSWKGLVGQTVTIQANPIRDDTGSYTVLRANDTYLVFAYKGDDEETLRVPIGCASHKSLKETAAKIRVLDALTKIPGTPSIAQRNRPLVQADVYNALYEAHVQCDDNLDQSRSEFITDMFEQNRGNTISMELLRKLLTHRIKVAKQSIADKTRERELFVAEGMRAPGESSDERIASAKASQELHEKIRQIDDFIRGKRPYVEIHECVLAVL